MLEAAASLGSSELDGAEGVFDTSKFVISVDVQIFAVTGVKYLKNTCPCLESFHQIYFHKLKTTLSSTKSSTCILDPIPTRLLRFLPW